MADQTFFLADSDMSFTDWSLDAGETLQADAVLEMCGLNVGLWYDDDEDLTEMSAALGGFTVLHQHYSETDFPPATMLVRQDDNLYFFVSGTNRDFLGNIANCMGVLDYSPWGTGMYTNSFFLSCMRAIMPRFRNNLPRDWQSCHLHFTGHSQGAAVSCMLAISLAAEFGNLHYKWMGFGCPKFLAGALLPTNLAPEVAFVVANEGDLVVAVPPNLAILAVNVASTFTWGIPTTWYCPGYFLNIDRDGNHEYIRTASGRPSVTPVRLHPNEVKIRHLLDAYDQTIDRFWERAHA